MKRRSLGAGFLAKFVTSSLVTSGYKESDLKIATVKILTYNWLTVFWFEVLSGSNYRESLFNWICVTTITRLDRKPFNHKLCINCFKATVAMTDDRFEEVIRKTTALLILARLDNWLFAARCVNWIFLPLTLIVLPTFVSDTGSLKHSRVPAAAAFYKSWQKSLSELAHILNLKFS